MQPWTKWNAYNSGERVFVGHSRTEPVASEGVSSSSSSSSLGRLSPAKPASDCLAIIRPLRGAECPVLVKAESTSREAIFKRSFSPVWKHTDSTLTRWPFHSVNRQIPRHTRVASATRHKGVFCQVQQPVGLKCPFLVVLTTPDVVMPVLVLKWTPSCCRALGGQLTLERLLKRVPILARLYIHSLVSVTE
ncbi:unnamed protein product [Protopolystoma xenopodis]|uniref:Uncharacterized protein n=1 Tax=Protopolystoma xenopodis TaxID=117903 RepID=A0A3S5ASV0_9PLAT|nr:unnamed protein product [Protopolystoma xenopodis]